VAKAECPEGVCPGTLADENLRLLMDLDDAASDQVQTPFIFHLG
jgi:hypothetical protein